MEVEHQWRRRNNNRALTIQQLVSRRQQFREREIERERDIYIDIEREKETEGESDSKRK